VTGSDVSSIMWLCEGSLVAAGLSGLLAGASQTQQNAGGHARSFVSLLPVRLEAKQAGLSGEREHWQATKGCVQLGVILVLVLCLNGRSGVCGSMRY